MLTFAKTTAIATSLFVGATFTAQAAELNAPSGVYKVDPTHASVTWKINHLGLSNYTARFTGIDATINLNAENQSASTVTVSIDPKTVTTDYPFPKRTDFDAELQNDKFFHSAKFPSIDFQSTKLELIDDKHGKLTGNLTLRGVTRPVILDVTLNGSMKVHPFVKKPAMGFSATTTIKRSEFGMVHLIPFGVGDDVTVQIEAEFVKAD